MMRIIIVFLVLFCCTAQSNQRIVTAAYDQVGKTLLYDPAYVRLPYPNGDISIVRGVCSDVVIRALRPIGWDLQQLVHEDMQANFKLYPQNWGLTRPDSNIDHRRVPNLMTYFKRQGFALPLSRAASDYLPGDIVAWRLDNNLPHIGIVADQYTHDNRPYIIHNIGIGTRVDDRLFSWKIIGHYRLFKS